MIIGTDRNTTYGGVEVTNKYSPLLNISFESSTTAKTFYSNLLLNRWTMLNSTGLLPQPLILAVADWDATIANAGSKPPLVVISSNRSEWIKAGHKAALDQPAIRQPYANASDIRALTAEKSQKVSPPIYCTPRIGDAHPRNVYVVVHLFEYDTYLKNLAGTGIRVVGWSFRIPRAGAAQLAGFGASRYAAIEFCKELRRAATDGGQPPWNYAWLFDDNVVALTKFPGYAAVEAKMTDKLACAGFHGGSSAETFTSIREWARDNWEGDEGRQAASLPKSETPGIIQQAALWNIDYLTRERLNFGPAFVASGEDVSLGNYFNAKKIPYLYYKGITVRKEQPSNDNSEGSRWVKGARERLTAWFTEMESSEPDPPHPPPPIKVQPIRSKDGGAQTLTDYIVKRVITDCALNPEDRTLAAKNTAKSHAIEQITCGAINEGYVNDDALNKTFKINGTGAGAAQTVLRIDKH